MISPVQCADIREAPTLTSHTPANPGGMRELMLRGLRSAPLFLFLPLPGNYSPGCAFDCYRDPSSASPSSSWRIWQLLLLPRLFLMLPRREAAGSCYPGTFRSLHFCSCSAASLPLQTPLLSVASHLDLPPALPWRLCEKSRLNLSLLDPQVSSPGVPGARPLSGKLLL